MRDVASEPLDTLREILADCGHQYLSGELTSQRRAVTNALYGVAKYLEASGFPPATLLPIIRPALALFEREEHNALDRMFVERARSGRPSTTIDAYLRTAILAALANNWLQNHRDDDRPQRTKLAEAARQMRGHWFRGVTGATLKTAREAVAREARDHEVVEYFERVSRLIDVIAETTGASRSFSFMVRYVNEHPVGRTMGILKSLDVSALAVE